MTNSDYFYLHYLNLPYLVGFMSSNLHCSDITLLLIGCQGSQCFPSSLVQREERETKIVIYKLTYCKKKQKCKFV